jgi:hypothetical protein
VGVNASGDDTVEQAATRTAVTQRVSVRRNTVGTFAPSSLSEREADMAVK